MKMMKTIKVTKFVQPGSQKELDFLQRAAQEGLLLIAAKWCRYTFAKATTSNFEITTEFSDRPITATHLDTAKELGLASILQRKLFLLDHFLVYTYTPIKKSVPKKTQDDQSKLAELDYWVDNRSKYNMLQGFVAILLALSWFLLNLSSQRGWADINLFVISLPLLLMIGWFAWYYKYAGRRKERIDQLEKDTGDFRDLQIDRWLISFKKQTAAPKVESLAHLGRWELITQSKNGKNYYYYLYANLPQEALESEISSVLGISKQEFDIVSPLGLYPLGYWM